MLEEKHITELMALRVRAMTCTKQQCIYFGIVDTLNVRLGERVAVGEGKGEKTLQRPEIHQEIQY